MKGVDRIEIYYKGALIACVNSSIVPRKGELMSILKTTYKVLRTTYAIDDSQDTTNARMRCNIDVILKR